MDATMRALACLLACLALLTACGSKESPEAQVRHALAKLEAAAEARNTRDFLDGVSESYRDARGADRGEAANTLRGYFLINQSIHLLTSIEEMSFPTPGEAHVKVKVGMVGKQGDSTFDLATNVRDFDVVFREEDGDWKVTYARWDGGA
jgi:hypothetical protein